MRGARIIVVVAVALGALWLALHERGRVAGETGGDDASSGRAVADLPRPALAGTTLVPIETVDGSERSRLAPSASPRVGGALDGRVRLVDGGQCGGGWAFAWPDGLVPTAELFRSFAEGGDCQPVLATPIAHDGTFRFEGMVAGQGYTLTAVSRGTVCVERPVGIRAGADPVELELWFAYGLAIRLVERGGSPVRTTRLLFGRGPIARGAAKWLRENPPELQALRIAGLEPGPGTRDRRQSLIAERSPDAAAIPLEFEVQVPGYSLVTEPLAAPRLLDRLAEHALELEPCTSSWGRIAMRARVSPEIRAGGLDPGEIVGSVHLFESGRDPVAFALHARAFDELEEIDGIPAGTYQVLFQASEASFEADLGRVEIGAGRNVLEVDSTANGGLLFEIEADGRPYDGRFTAKVNMPHGGHFYVAFDRGPYLVPIVMPGLHRLSELVAPGRSCAVLTGGEIEVVAGRLSVALVSCASAPSERR